MPNHTPGQLAYILYPGISQDHMAIWLVRCSHFYQASLKAHPAKQGPRVNYQHIKLIWCGRNYNNIKKDLSYTFSCKESQLAFSNEEIEAKFQNAIDKHISDFNGWIYEHKANIKWYLKHIEDCEQAIKNDEYDITRLAATRLITLPLENSLTA